MRLAKDWKILVILCSPAPILKFLSKQSKGEKALGKDRRLLIVYLPSD
ncbi:MAG: hypothetical protein ACJA2E_001504 [Arenicella sp.]|jgi:hypothetical protein